MEKQEQPKSFEEILQQRVARNKMKRRVTRELQKKKKSEQTVKIYSSPYAYIYAPYLKGSKYEKTMRSVENRLTDLGISGRIHRLSQFKNLKEMIEDDLRRGITTIVVVGDDKIVNEAIEIAVEAKIVLGIIPLGGENKIASLLGIPEGVEACNILSRRLIQFFDIGKINNKTFFSRLFISGQRVPIICDKQYEIMSFGGDIFIFNLNLEPEDKTIPKINSKDGRFEILARHKQTLGAKLLGKKEAKKDSLFYAKNLSMKSNIAFSIYVDGKKNFYKDARV
ncbi:hypothetical protein KJ885_02975, partial [Patescibacteria group bacterium]|nr:hypothetical protein [Patescibacteria group bacterium]